MKKSILAACAAMLVAGCNVVSVRNGPVHLTAYMPAWPWQDGSRVIERASMTARTNVATVDLRGMSEQQTTSTNEVFERMVSAAVGAAVRAAKP